LLADISSLFYFVAKPEEAFAAQSTIDALTAGTGTSFLHGNPQSVFISDLVGYKFYRDSGLNCRYSKTTDGGNTWGAAVTFDNQTDCIAIAVWYDQWTPGDNGTLIHLATIDTGNDDIFYNALNTSGDTLATTSSTTTNPVNLQGGTFTAGANYPAITKGTDGTLYVAINDSTDRYVLECSATCSTSNNWTETGITPLDLVDGDYNLLVPRPNGDIMVINRDVSAEDIRFKTWNNTAWSGAWTMIDPNATDNTTYDIAMSAVVSSTTNNIYLAYVADHTILGADDDIRVGFFNNNTWSTSTPVLNAPIGITGVALGLDKSNSDLYLAYTGTTTTSVTSANVYWRVAQNGSSTQFGAQQGPINTATDDIYGIDINGVSDERMYVSWFANSVDDVLGNTIADIAPGIYVSASTSQIGNVFSSTTNQYIGGKFVIRETLSSRNVTGLTITETGTINAQTSLDNIKLFSEQDTTYPYNCDSVTYGGGESQFGSTDADGFSATDGTSSFTGSVAISTTSTMCVYVVSDLTQSAVDGLTINYEITDPVVDVVISGGGEILSTTTVALASSTTVLNDDLTLIHYHWRNDDGTEAAASSAQGGVEDTVYLGLQENTTKRLRLEVANKGSSSTPLMQYRLEYGLRDTSCSEISVWTDVGAAGGDFDMSNSVNLTDGNNTTNIALGLGGVTDDVATFLTPNGGVKDTSSQTAAVSLPIANFLELEYSVIATSTVPDGTSYCFRVTDAGRPIDIYTEYPRAAVAADMRLTASGTQAVLFDIPTTTAYMGGQFVFQVNTAGTKDITGITLTASGTVNFATDLSNIRLTYDLDTTAPYDCASESYSGSETQFGSAGTFNVTGSTTFTGTVTASSTRAVCVYTILDVSANTQDSATLDIRIHDPQTDIVRSSGTLAPSATVPIEEMTTMVKAVLTQSRYHWRQNNGTEITASSSTNGLEDTALSSIQKGTTTRLRIEISNEGSSTTLPKQYRLEYAQKISSCAAVSTWTDVGAAGGDFDMSNSTGLTEGADTTNIAGTGFGAVTDENTTFVTPNGGQKDTTSQTGNINLLVGQFTELEYSIIASTTSSENATYCFRVSDAGVALSVYTIYPEATVKIPNDFFVQRGVTVITVGTSVITAGVDYIAPSASTSAFIRITNTQHTGAGTSAGTASQNADDVTAYILNAGNIMTSVTFQRQTTAPAGNTRVAWEIVEYTGPTGGDNEFKVRQAQALTYATTATTSSTTAAVGVVDDSDVAVFITGQWQPDTSVNDYNTVLSTADWVGGVVDRAVFSRGEASADAVRLSFAVVEFTGANWNIQRVEHAYTTYGSIETEPITAVNSLSRTFLHVQKRVGAGLQTHAHFGHEVWLSSVGTVSFQLEAQASSTHVSVAWVIENTQTSGSVMDVTRSNGTQTGGTAPRVVIVPIGKTLTDVTNASIFTNNRSTGLTNTYPEPMMMVRLIATSTTDYEIWVSNTTDTRTYRTEVVEWPTAKRQISQNVYQIYVNENAIDPTTRWPASVGTLGENTAMTGLDYPMSTNDVARIRMSLNVSGQSSMPPGIDAFKLQYGKRTTPSCTAVSEWFDIGDSASTTAVWRGFDNTNVSNNAVLSTNPPTGGDLNLSESDRAGTYQESNNTPTTPFLVRPNEDVEFDWVVQNNSADVRSSYCFRMIESDDTVLTAYNNYPTLKTIGYGTESQNWRWYDDAQTETPVTPLAGETIAPIDIDYDNSIALRVTLHEFNGASGPNAKFKLQFSESSTFATSTDVTGSSTCTNLSYWCYAPGGGADGSTITTKTLSDADACVAGVGRGCGTHTSSSTSASSYTQQATSSAEFSFTIRHAGARANRTYYFRAFDVVNSETVLIGTGQSYPSLTTKGAEVTFSVTGVATSTVTEGVTTDTGTTPTSIAYGTLPVDTMRTAAYQLSVTANATEGYQIFVYNPQALTSSGGSTIAPVSASNTAPVAWGTACDSGATGCFGYHVGDDTLSEGSARFAPNDTYAALETTPREVAYSSVPVTSDTTMVIYRVLARSLQPAGRYATQLTYLIVPVF